ncbi:MAG: dihydropteroate synthase [Deltaproteobacteria bacterium]|jgi:dihydropteroate synthase|nr:dihydropteroate synthase [Deltaproteobacteria bacterium]
MPHKEWIILNGRMVRFSRPLLAGIINVTPDSFSDGGLYLEPDQALRRARQLLEDGADILDLGGESTRPGADLITPAEELARLEPVMRGLNTLRRQTGAAVQPVSVDTWRAATARRMLEAGAEIINDISGGLFDPRMDEVLAEFRPGFILGHCPAAPRHMQEAPFYTDVVEALYVHFSLRLEALDKAGLPARNVILDPGLGFGKTTRHNLEILRRLERLRPLGRPLCIGLSRKNFLGELLGLEQGPARDPATHTAVALLARQGASLHRVHEVKGAARALKLMEAIIPEETLINSELRPEPRWGE